MKMRRFHAYWMTIEVELIMTIEPRFISVLTRTFLSSLELQMTVQPDDLVDGSYHPAIAINLSLKN
jgi:hypothetical protein